MNDFIIINKQEIYQKDRDELDMLHNYIKYKSLKEIKSLNVSQYNQDSFTKNCDTPIITAYKRGEIDIVQYLIDNKFNIHSETAFNENGIHIAVKNNNIKLLKKLCNLKLDINHKDINSDTPLHLSIRLGYIKATKVLYNYNPRIDIKNKSGESVLDIISPFCTLENYIFS
jgi:ankyrin repeat protein